MFLLFITFSPKNSGFLAVPHGYTYSPENTIYGAVSEDPGKLEADALLYGVARVPHLASEVLFLIVIRRHAFQYLFYSIIQWHSTPYFQSYKKITIKFSKIVACRTETRDYPARNVP